MHLLPMPRHVDAAAHPDIGMAAEFGAEYIELANTQYYSWAYLNRAELLPTREQLKRAEAGRKQPWQGGHHSPAQAAGQVAPESGRHR